MQMETIKNQVGDWFEKFKENMTILLEEKFIIREHEPDIREKIHNAHQEWLEAMNYFDNVTDPDLVDHASFLMGAARSKYIFYLKQLKNRE